MNVVRRNISVLIFLITLLFPLAARATLDLGGEATRNKISVQTDSGVSLTDIYNQITYLRAKYQSLL